MARRLVWMPVLPSVTASLAAYLRGSWVSASALRMELRANQAAPSPREVLTMNCLRFMGASLRGSSLTVVILDDQRRRLAAGRAVNFSVRRTRHEFTCRC